MNELTSCDQALDHRCVLDAVDSNTHLLQQVLQQVLDLRDAVAGPSPDGKSSSGHSRTDSTLLAECEQLRDQVYDLQEQIGRLQQFNAELQQQNADLAARVANSSVRNTVSTTVSGSSDALSWEERKQLILQQMENDAFDADAFVEQLQSDCATQTESPSEFVASLHDELERFESELAHREQEIRELRCLLEQQSETRDGGVAIGAAAIAQMVDGDELIQQERQRLQLLQAEWEEKFRKTEIEASLERAKLSRERQELAKKTAELEEQLEHSRRESRQSKESGPGSRRWMVKLGLADDEAS